MGADHAQGLAIPITFGHQTGIADPNPMAVLMLNADINLIDFFAARKDFRQRGIGPGQIIRMGQILPSLDRDGRQFRQPVADQGSPAF